MSGSWDTPVPSPCRFGYVEHDGNQYCFEHYGWHHYTDKVVRRSEAQRALVGNEGVDHG